jgi:nucleotide-binding universal stress UspA family protein
VDSHAQKDRPSDRLSRILIPVNGTAVSRRAVEVGLALARAASANVTVLYVTRGGANGGDGKAATRRRATRRNEQAVFKDIRALAERYEVELRMKTRANVTPDKAILDESKHGYDLIVLGVSRRPGDTLHFGNTAGAVLDRSNVSNLFVAS